MATRGRSSEIKINVIADADTRGFKDAGVAAKKLESALDGIDGQPAAKQIKDVGAAADGTGKKVAGLGAESKASLDGMSDTAGELFESFTGAGGGIQGVFEAIKGGAGGVAIAVGALGLVIAQMVAKSDMVRQLRNQFGLAEAEAHRSGAAAGRVYARGFGDSVGEVATATATVLRDLEGVAEASTDTQDEIVAGALTIARVFDQDVNRVIRAAGQLLRNGLAPDAETALDVIAVGFQQGADRSEDFLDTLNEYAPQFSQLGIDGETATDLIVAGLQAGAHNSDKLADSFKEFGVRAREGAEAAHDALRALGLDADQVIAAINDGGPGARDALFDVLQSLDAVDDRMVQQRIGVALFGTQWEDTSGDVITALADVDGKLEDLVGTTRKLNEESAKSSVSYLNRVKAGASDLVDMLGRAAGADPGWAAQEEAARKAEKASEEASKALRAQAREAFESGESWRVVALSADDHAAAIARLAAQTSVSADDLAIFGMRAADAESEIALLRGTAEALAERLDGEVTSAVRDMGGVYDEFATAVRDATAAQEEQYAGVRARVDKQYAAERAVIATAQAMVGLDRATADLTAAEAEHGAGSTEAADAQLRLASATLSTKEALINQAQAAADSEIANREASGEVLTLADENGILATKLIEVSDTLLPGSPLRDGLTQYAAELDAVPDDVTTFIDVQGVDEASGKLGGFLGVLDSVRRAAGNMVINPNINYNTQLPGVAGVVQPRAAGGPIRAGAPYMVGEQGPELVVPSNSGTVIPNGGGGGVTVNITLNGPVLSDEIPPKVAKAIETALAKVRRENS